MFPSYPKILYFHPVHLMLIDGFFAALTNCLRAEHVAFVEVGNSNSASHENGRVIVNLRNDALKLSKQVRSLSQT